MESISKTKEQIVSLSNGRRVLKALKKFTDPN